MTTQTANTVSDWIHYTWYGYIPQY